MPVKLTCNICDKESSISEDWVIFPPETLDIIEDIAICFECSVKYSDKAISSNIKKCIEGTNWQYVVNLLHSET